MGKKIVVVGSSNTDMIIKIDRIPRPGETVIGGRFSTAPGGKGANQAVAAARAGGDVAFIARVGNDMFGSEALKGFAADEINIDHVTKDTTAPSGVASIFVDKNGENSIAVASGANANLSPADIEAAEKTIACADILVMQLETPIETVTAAAMMAHADGVKVILNPAPAQPLTDDLLKTVSILTPNESEAELLTGIGVENEDGARKAAEALLAKGVATVMVTLGENGVIIATADGVKKVDAFEVDPVDTTAAGDVFNGALAVAIAEGSRLEKAVLFANAAAAMSVTKLGAQPSAPTRHEIDEFMKNH
ncbi:MAG: ribokinase [Planctomycetes bacterium]|nr:ribokinase [Planctomycetota bacterium]